MNSLFEITKDLAEYAQQELFCEYEIKGPRPSATTHEILGIITEEYFELIDAVKSNNLHQVHQELRDIMVASLHGIRSVKEILNVRPNR